MEIPLLKDIIIILGLSIFIIIAFQRLKVPAILGFLLTGVVVGPYGLSLIEAKHEVELLAEIGIIFLLFVIGIEFSLKGLSSIRKTVLVGGITQVGGTIVCTSLITHAFGLDWNQSIFMGFLLSLSSTAIVLNLLQAKGDITAPHGRISVAILIFQDIIVVPMILFTPILAGQDEGLITTLAMLFAKFAGVLILIFLLAKYVMPWILKHVVRTKSRELFLLTIIFICFSTAWVTSAAGLSLALGAFFAGLIISESEYSHQATANILPLRELFISFFFVSIGMLLDVTFLFSNFLMVMLFTLGVILLKGSIVAFGSIILRYPARTVILTALSLFQVGEFAFILAGAGLAVGLLPSLTYQYFLSISIISMAMTPFVFNVAPRVVTMLLNLSMVRKVDNRLTPASLEKGRNEDKSKYHDHLVIIGFGINGKNLATAAKNADIPYRIIELNPESVKKARAEGEPIVFGDATHDLILHHVNIHDARVVVIAISDPLATKKIVAEVRLNTKMAYIIVRTRYVAEMEELQKLGADEVIPEEFETSIEIFSRVLAKYLVPVDKIQAFINQIRSGDYTMLREPLAFSGRDGLEIPDARMVALPVRQGNNKVVGKSIEESGLKKRFGVNVLAIKREKNFITIIKPEEKIRQDDILYVFGSIDGISRLNEFLRM